LLLHIDYMFRPIHLGLDLKMAQVNGSKHVVYM